MELGCALIVERVLRLRHKTKETLMHNAILLERGPNGPSSSARTHSSMRVPRAAFMVSLLVSIGVESGCQMDNGIEEPRETPSGAEVQSSHESATDAARPEDDWSAREFARERSIEVGEAHRRLSQQS